MDKDSHLKLEDLPKKTRLLVQLLDCDHRKQDFMGQAVCDKFFLTYWEQTQEYIITRSSCMDLMKREKCPEGYVIDDLIKMIADIKRWKLE